MTKEKAHTKKRMILTLVLTICLCFLSAVPEILAEAATAKPTISAKTLTIHVGDTKTLTVKNGKNVKWTTSNKTIATVSAGKVKAIKAGKAVITAKVGKVSLKCTVTVKPKPTISAKTSTLFVGQSRKLTVKNGINVKWSTSNKSVATVSNGTVKAVKAGKAVISAKSGKYTLKCTVTVKAKPTISAKTSTLYVGQTRKLTVKNATSVEWSTSNESVATVSEGAVKAVKAGKAVITAKAGTFTLTCTVTVKPKPTISDESVSLVESQTAKLTVNNGSNVIWSSSDENIATVSAGTVTGVSAGTAVISAKTGTFTLTCTVTVKPKPTISDESISMVKYQTKTITVNNASNVIWSSSDENIVTVSDGNITSYSSVGTAVITAKTGEFTLTCTVTVTEAPKPIIENGSTVFSYINQTQKLTLNNASDAIWSSSDENIATISDGIVTGVSVGTAVITAETEEYIFTWTVTVTPTISDESVTIFEGETVQLTVNSDSDVIWSSSDENIATVSDGIVTGVSAGTAVISAKTGTFTLTCTVTVNLKPTISNESMSIYINQTKQLTVNNASDVIWSSSDENIVTVSDGFITSYSSVGTAVITAKTGEFTLTCTVTVEAIPGTISEFDKFPKWDFINNIDKSSIRSEADGTVYFSANGPDGQPVRFMGCQIEIGDDGILFHEGGEIVSLDSIGRIYGFKLAGDAGEPRRDITVQSGYDTDMNLHPDTKDHMIFNSGAAFAPFPTLEGYGIISLENFQPNFIRISGGGNSVSDCILYYEPDDTCTPIRDCFLCEDFYHAYLEGERYSLDKEQFDLNQGILTFYLCMVPELKHPELHPSYEDMEKMDMGLYAVPIYNPAVYQIGDLKDADGNILDKKTATVHEGMTLTVTIANRDYDVKLPVCKPYNGASTMHDLVPYAYPAATGELKPLVIPIAWQDEPQNATDTQLKLFKNELGRVEEADGTVKDYSGALTNRYSLSKYFDTASYGKLKITSHITDWYPAPHDFAEYKNRDMNKAFIDEVLSWLYSTYPNTDWSEYDRDGNGYIDAVIFLNAGDMSQEGGFNIISFGGAIQYRQTYGSEFAGSTSKPGMNNIVNMNAMHFKDNTLIHEFGHGFGLIDYYDVTYSGRDAVGGYDMQSSNKGDWNAYSKYAVGWIEPKVVSGLAKGESVDIEIGTLADKGDAIVIPAAGEDPDSPFSEYMLVDLFAGTGVNQYDAKNWSDIGNTIGVRMYHVDAKMEYRDYVNPAYPDMTPCPIGTIKFANDFKTNGKYNLELIQAGGKNTFTNPTEPDRTTLQNQDFFKAGDTFTTKKYSEFFDGGMFDAGQDFGYSIKVVSITGSGSNARAVIRITRQ